MPNYYYRDKSGKEIGPVELNTLAKLRFAGILNGDTPVRQSDSSEWKPCREWIADQPPTAPSQPISAPSGPASPLFTPKLAILIFVGALIYGGMVFYKSVAAKTAVTYDLQLDGKSLPPGSDPTVKIDGQWLESGGHIRPGRHLISVGMNNVEPFEKHFWVIYGTKNLENLPLESCKGSLLVTVAPMPATISVQQSGQIIKEGDAPLKLDKITAGLYQLSIKHANYLEKHDVEVRRQQETDTNIQLNLGKVSLASLPPDADYIINDANGHHWEGKLPANIEDVPAGNYTITVNRQGWDLRSGFIVTAAGKTTNITKFPYASVSITSEPSGMSISSGDDSLGKTPLTLRMKPGSYVLTASDGENDLTENLTLGSNDVAQKTFTFHYGILKLVTVPSGASVLRKGKEIGETPLVLRHVPVGNSSLQLRLEGYITTNITISASTNSVTNIYAKLISKTILTLIKQGQDALEAGRFDESQRAITAALETDPEDSSAMELQRKLYTARSKAEDVRKEAEHKEAVVIIEKAIASRGGAEFLQRMHALRASGDVSGTDEGGNTYSGTIIINLVFHDKLKITQDITVQIKPKSVNLFGGLLSATASQTDTVRRKNATYCVTETSAWSTTAMPSEAENSLRNSLKISRFELLFSLLDINCQIKKVKSPFYAPENSTTIDCKTPYFTDVLLHFDNLSGLLVGTDYLDMSSQGKLVRKSLRYYKFREISGGVQEPTMQESYSDGRLTQTFFLRQAEFLSGLPDDLFRP